MNNRTDAKYCVLKKTNVQTQYFASIENIIMSSGVSLNYMRERNRDHPHIFPRYYFIENLLNLDFKLIEIAKILNIHHATVLHARKSAKEIKENNLICNLYFKHAITVYHKLHFQIDNPIFEGLFPLDYHGIVEQLKLELSKDVFSLEFNLLDRRQRELLSWQMIFLGCRYADVLHLNSNLSHHDMTDEAIEMPAFKKYHEYLKLCGLKTYLLSYNEIDKHFQNTSRLILA